MLSKLRAVNHAFSIWFVVFLFNRLKSRTCLERQLFDWGSQSPSAWWCYSILPVSFPKALILSQWQRGCQLQRVTAQWHKSDPQNRNCHYYKPNSWLPWHLMSLIGLMRICLSQVQKVRESLRHLQMLSASCTSPNFCMYDNSDLWNNGL